MTKQRTNEFSIILTLGETASNEILAIRKMLGKPQFKDGPPHVTLLNAITHADWALVNDNSMLPLIKPILDKLMQSKPTVSVQQVATYSSRAYGDTTTIVVDVEKTVHAARKQLETALLQAGWHIKPETITHFMPHISLQLGSVAKPESSALQLIKTLPKTMPLVDWQLTRLLLVDKKRTFPIIQK